MRLVGEPASGRGFPVACSAYLAKRLPQEK